MWGSCFWLCAVSRLLLLLLLRTIFHTAIFHTTTFSHTIFHTTTFSHTIFHSNFLSHTQSFTATFSHTIFLTTTFSHTIFHPQLCHIRWHAWVPLTFVLRCRRGTCSHRPSFCVAGMALMTLGWIWRRAWAPLFARGAAALCVAGVALGDIDVAFAWQAWHLLTSTFVLCGRRGVYDTGLALVARLGTVSRPWRRGTLRGRCGTWRHRPSFCVAGVALAWQAWHL